MPEGKIPKSTPQKIPEMQKMDNAETTTIVKESQRTEDLRIQNFMPISHAYVRHIQFEQTSTKDIVWQDIHSMHVTNGIHVNQMHAHALCVYV